MCKPYKRFFPHQRAILSGGEHDECKQNENGQEDERDKRNTADGKTKHSAEH